MTKPASHSRYSSLSISLHWVMLIPLVAVYACMELRGYYLIITPDPPVWQTLFAKLTHLALDALMIAMPIAGWVILSASDKVIPFYGLSLPTLVGPDKALATQVKELHETFATLGYFLIGLHALAAPFHHYATKNNTLQRILPHRRLQEHRNWN